MTTQATHAFGTFIKVGDGGTPESFATIAEVLDIAGPDNDSEKEDATSHDSGGWEEKIITILKAGTVVFPVNFIPGHATHSAASGFLADWMNRTRRNYQLAIADGPTWSFAAFVGKAPVSFPVKGKKGANITLEITGQPTLA